MRSAGFFAAAAAVFLVPARVVGAEVDDVLLGFATPGPEVVSTIEGGIDLSEVWVMTEVPESTNLLYSATAWGTGLDKHKVTLSLRDLTTGKLTILAKDLPGDGEYVWDFAGLRTRCYEMVHTVIQDYSWVTNDEQTLVAHYDFTGADLPQLDEDFQLAVRGLGEKPLLVSNDVENAWRVLGGTGEGARTSPRLAAGDETALELTVYGTGDLSLQYLLTGGSVSVTVNGEAVTSPVASANWTAYSVSIATDCLTNLVRISYVAADGGYMAVKDIVSNCVTPATPEEIRLAAFADISQSFTFENDENSPWDPIDGAGAGVVAPAEVGSVFAVTVKGAGEFGFDWSLAAGTLTVTVDGRETMTLTEASGWQQESLVFSERGTHIVRFVASEGDGIAVKAICWHEDVGEFVSAEGDVFCVDLREGVRVIADKSEILPFTYSATNFTGLAANAVASSVSVVRMAGEGDDVSLWTDEVPGTARVLHSGPDEGTVAWWGRAGVWKAAFVIVDGMDAPVHLETAILDLRKCAHGFMLLLK